MGKSSWTKTVKEPCVYCNKDIYPATMNRHHTSCYMNPINLRSCNICGFPVKQRAAKTCGYACSNKFFRTGPNHGNWKESQYVTTCFHYHKKQCVVCDEQLVVEVHHLDEDKTNNDPTNLIPLCPTHHRYWHSRHKHLVIDAVTTYVDDWKLKNNRV